MKKSLTLFAVFVFAITSLKAQWSLLHTGVTNDIYRISIPTPDTGYAVAYTQIIKTTNGGATWLPVSTQTGIVDIFFTTKDTGFILRDSLIRRSFDGGVSWSTVKIFPGNYSLGNLAFPSHNIGYVSIINAGADSTFIYKTTDKGSTWNLLAKIPVFPNFSSSLYFFDQNIGYIGTGSGIYQTINGGLTWTQRNTDNGISSFSFPTSLIGYAAGMNGGTNMYKTTDGGMTWNPSTNNILGAVLYTVTFITSTLGYAVGGDGLSTGYIYKTIDGGANWTVDYNSSKTYYDICFPSASIGYASATGGEMVKMGGTIGINEEHQNVSALNVFPNPSNGSFKIDIRNLIGQHIELAIFDLLGKQVYMSEESTISNGSMTKTIDLNLCPKGMYFVRVRDGAKVYSEKVVVQ
jgi:photosystem II stability/assembly factor-like uncharacterized protein